MKKFYFVILSVLLSGLVSAQTAKVNVSGLVVDEKGMPMVGASVTVPGTSFGTIVDANGAFTLSVPASAKQVSVTFIGFKDANVNLTPGVHNLGTIKLQSEAQMMQDVVITQSIAVQRKTPVAVSSIDMSYIEERLGAQEFPEVLKATPGVYATKDGGGFGDSKINMRGFQSANIAVMINGVPVNDMEWGGVYWSNWAGLSDVTRSMQTQRGLGASKVSSPSVGGTINIVTRSLDAKAGGTLSYGIGNDGAQNLTFSVSTGVTKNGWALTVLGGKKWGDGYIQGTEYSGYNYFVNISKRINKDHQLSLTAFGAPQKHNQRSSYDGLTIREWDKVQRFMGDDIKYKYNPTYGFDKNGQRRASAVNEYHKPQISLNWQWQINEKSSLSTAAYVSIARGYGFSGDGATSTLSNQWYGASNGILNTTFRKADGTFDYGAIQDLNAASTTGSQMIMAKSVNNHEWYGLLSTYTNRLNDWLELSAGIDMRYYTARHTKEISDLYDGAYYMDRYRANVNANNNAAAADPTWRYEKLGVGDVIYRDYDGHVFQGGAFAQLELSRGAWSAFVSGSLSNTTYWRYDRFYYDAAHAKSGKVSFLGGTIKAGANYNIDKRNNVFVNVGFISRAPFYSGGAFLNSTVSNTTNPNAVNEKILSAEVGYGYRSPYFAFNFNGYFTEWMDKTMAKSSDMTYVNDKGETVQGRWSVNMEGVNARHMGLEIDFTAKPTTWLDIRGMASWGDWKWDSNATGYFYNENGQPLADTKGTIASGVGADDHLRSTLNLKGIRVGGSAQTTGMIGLTFKPLKGLRVGGDWTVFARNYADYTINYNNITPGSTTTITKPWQIPWGQQFDLHANYSFKVGNRCRATIYGNVNNVFNNFYIVDAYEGGSSTWEDAYRVFYAFGRTFTVRLKLNF